MKRTLLCILTCSFILISRSTWGQDNAVSAIYDDPNEVKAYISILPFDLTNQGVGTSFGLNLHALYNIDNKQFVSAHFFHAYASSKSPKFVINETFVDGIVESSRSTNYGKTFELGYLYLL